MCPLGHTVYIYKAGIMHVSPWAPSISYTGLLQGPLQVKIMAVSSIPLQYSFYLVLVKQCVHFGK